MTPATKQSFLFRIYGTYPLKEDRGTILTGHIQSGTVCLNDQLVYIGKLQTPVFECTVADIEKLPMTRLTEASAEEMGQRSISMQILGRLEHEFETGGFFIKLN
jgi:translation elongation factor EF-Tu-like GTPase